MATQTIVNDKNNPNALKADDGASIFKPILIGALILVAIVVSYSIYKNQQNDSINELGDKIYVFETKFYQPLVDKKEGADINKMISEFELLFSLEGSRTGALTAESIKVADYLIKQNKVDDANRILKKALNFADNDLAKYFLISRLGVLEQDRGEYDSAIKMYKSLLSQKITVMEDKTYLDLGILYSKIGDKEKAKTSINYVLEKSKDETLLKIARFYLDEL